MIIEVNFQPELIASRSKFQAGLSSRDKISAGLDGRSKVPAAFDIRILSHI